MLKITPLQRDTLAANVDQPARIVAWLRKRQRRPFMWMPDDLAKNLVLTSYRRAQDWGLCDGSCVAFIGLMAEFGSDFDRHEAVQRALKASRNGNSLDPLLRAVSTGDWATFRRSSSTIGWRLDRVVWNRPVEERVEIALAETFAQHSRQPPSAPRAAIAEAKGFGRACASTGQDGLYTLSLWTLLEPDPQRRNDLLRASLDRTANAKVAVASLKLRLQLEHGIWT